MSKTLTDRIQEMIGVLEESKVDARKADEGNAQAGRRFRMIIAQVPGMVKEAKNQSLGK
jgi:hypothetical protein